MDWVVEGGHKGLKPLHRFYWEWRWAHWWQRQAWHMVKTAYLHTLAPVAAGRQGPGE